MYYIYLALCWKVSIDGCNNKLWILLIEDIKLCIKGQSRDIESRESGFYLERLNSGSEVRVMRNKSQNGMGGRVLKCSGVGTSWE